MISANQLSVYGTKEDLCNVLPKDLRIPEKPAAPDHLETMDIPTDLSIAENSTNAQQRWNQVQECERKFEQLSENQKLSKLCCHTEWEPIETGQYFYTFDTDEGQQMQHQCREYTTTSMPRIHDVSKWKRTRVRGSVRKGARICPDIKICCRDDRHSIEVQVLSLFQDIVASWDWIVNDVYKYVTESLPLKEKEDTTSEKSICQVRPRQNTAVTLTSVSIHVLERKWIEIESQRSHNPKCDEVSKVITDYYDMDQSVPRGSDGAIHYSDIIEECRMKSDEGTGIDCNILDSRNIEIFSSVLTLCQSWYPIFKWRLRSFEQFKDIQEFNAVDPALQDNVLSPKGFIEYYIYHVGNELNSTKNNVFIPGGKCFKRGRQAIFFTTVIRWKTHVMWVKTPYDLTKPRIAPSKNSWKRLQKVQLEARSRENLQFYQTRLHAVFLYKTLFAACNEKAICIKTQEWALPQGSLNSESHVPTEFAIWTTRSTKSRRKTILGTIERFEKLRRNL